MDIDVRMKSAQNSNIADFAYDHLRKKFKFFLIMMVFLTLIAGCLFLRFSNSNIIKMQVKIESETIETNNDELIFANVVSQCLNMFGLNLQRLRLLIDCFHRSGVMETAML